MPNLASVVAVFLEQAAFLWTSTRNGLPSGLAGTSARWEQEARVFVFSEAPQLWNSSPAVLAASFLRLAHKCEPHDAEFLEKAKERAAVMAAWGETGALFGRQERGGEDGTIATLSRMEDATLLPGSGPWGKEEFLTAERLLVPNAGLVLVAAFFRQLFTAAGLWSEGRWKEEGSPQRAVHLAAYLATGLEKLPEHQLLLEKILCGLLPTETLPLDLELTREEKEEADSLLQSLRLHWKAVKNTSLAALRESFLLRPGLLTLAAEGWQLQVERKTLDVLIDNLPWTFSVIVHPWRKQPLFVTW